MKFEILLSTAAKDQIQDIRDNPSKRGLAKPIGKALNQLAENPNYPGLHSHPMTQFDTLFGAKVFSSYIQNKTPAAHRMLWVYGPKLRQITVVAVIPHY